MNRDDCFRLHSLNELFDYVVAQVAGSVDLRVRIGFEVWQNFTTIYLL
jgi:hypothetical protein